MKHFDVVAGVVINDSRVLCLQKGLTKYDYTRYKWEFPGGKIEEGETPPQALRRELIEELNLDVKVESHLITVMHKYKDFSITLRAYLCHADMIQVTLTEHSAFKWASIDEIANIDWCEADVAIAKAVIRELNH